MQLSDLSNMPFDKMYIDAFIAQHKFINYCEAIIYPDGMVQYAIPSHIEKLIFVLCEQNHWTRDEVKNKMPTTVIPINWLVEMSKCVSVWYSHIIKPFDINPVQIDSLERLSTHGIIHVDPYN